MSVAAPSPQKRVTPAEAFAYGLNALGAPAREADRPALGRSAAEDRDPQSEREPPWRAVGLLRRRPLNRGPGSQSDGHSYDCRDQSHRPPSPHEPAPVHPGVSVLPFETAATRL